MDMNLIIASIAVFLGIILILVVILLVAKKYLSPSGNVNITINGEDTLSVPQGASLLSTLAERMRWQGFLRPVQGAGACGRW